VPAVDARFSGQYCERAGGDLHRERDEKRIPPHAVTEASGLVSQRVFSKLGFEERYRVSYRDYDYGGEAVFVSIVGHDGARVNRKNALPVPRPSEPSDGL
jgi:hypothetical protein